MVDISAFIASSNDKGWSETGFAFGISPPMASVVEHSSLHNSSEPALPVANSAACYHGREDIRILPVVMTKRELRQVQRQIGFADIVIRADDTTLQQAPEAINVGRVYIPAHILALGVIDRLMREFTLQAGIACVLIRGDQGHASIHRFPHERAKGHAVRVLNDFADHVTLAGNGTDNADLAAGHASNVGFLAAMAVLILATDIRFVNLHVAHELPKAAILHGGSDPVAHIPRGAIVTGTDLAVNLQRANALLALGHEVDHLEPHAQVVVRVLKHSFGNDREAIAIASAAILTLAHPMKELGLERIDLLVLATRALHAIRPAHIPKKRLARFFRRKAVGQLRQGHGWLGRHRSSSVQMSGVYRLLDMVSSAT